MELPLLVDFLYVDRGRVSNTLAAGAPENVPSLAHRGVFNCQPSVTMANYLWQPCLHCITGLSRHHCTVKRWRITICHSSQVLPSERPRLWKELFSNRGDGMRGGRSAAAQECHTTIGFPVTGFLDETGEGAAVQGLIVTMVTVTDSLRERWKIMIWLQSSRTSASDHSKKTKKGGCFHSETSIQAWILYIHSPVHTHRTFTGQPAVLGQSWSDYPRIITPKPPEATPP